MSSYSVKQIDIIFELGQGTFGTTGSNKITLIGARCLVQTGTVINNSGAVGGINCVARIYGIPLSQLNQLTVAGLQYKVRDNRMTINAGVAGQAKTTIFSGLINESYPDFSESPNVALLVTGITSSATNMKPVPPLSFSGQISTSDAFQKMANNAGLHYEGNNVQGQLPNGYFAGTTGSQISQLAKWSNCYAFIDGNTLVTIPLNGNRAGSEVEVSKETGMISYPSYQGVFIVIRSIFNPSIKYWGLINVKSDLTPANGLWRVTDLQYSLSSQLPDGPWELQLKGTSQTTNSSS